MVSLKDRDQKEFQEKLQTEMAAQHVDGLILTDYGAILIRDLERPSR